VTLSNCPFHQLAESYTALVCGINLHLIGGLLDALPAGDLCANLAPAPGRCCVTVTTTPAP
jgi:predicted ArsR family transcriptional regulator